MQQSQSAAGQTRQEVSEIMNTLLAQNPNLSDIKQELAQKVNNIEKHNYHAMVGTSQQYLQVCGLTYHQAEHFNYLNQLLHQHTTDVLDRIENGIVTLHSTLPPPPPPATPTPPEIVQEVQEVLQNIDLPLSLFKRRDHYWSQDNSKTVQVRQYIKDLHQKDRKWKGELKRKRQEILNSQNQSYHRTIEETNRQQKKAKEDEKARMKKKIEMLKSMTEVRKKTIDEGLEYIRKHGRPLYKKMEEQYHAQVEIPSLQEKKRKLSEVRQLRRSVDLVQIQQHREKVDKIKEQHQAVKITNQPVKVSFKGRFHQSITASAVRDVQNQSRIKSLYEKRYEYSQMVNDNFKPQTNPDKVIQIQQRIEQMNKRYTRVKKAPKKGEFDDEDDEDQEEEEEEPEPQPIDDEEDQEDQEDQYKLPKDDQYQPSNQERYKMGIKFLEEAKKKRKMQEEKKERESKAGDDRSQADSKIEEVRRKTKSARGKTPPPDTTKIGIIPISNESNRKIKYRNYLQQMSKNNNKTIDFLDTSQIRTEVTNDLRLRGNSKLQQLQNKLRTVSEKAHQQEQLLKYKRMRRSQAIDKKQQLDKAMIDTIKARLAMMNH